MPVDDELAHRVREMMSNHDGLTERKMFGGLCFMLHGNMAVGITGQNDLMVRTGKERCTCTAWSSYAP